MLSSRILRTEMFSSSLTLTATKAPSMNSAPWAKLTTPSVPNTSVSPSAISA